MGDPRLADCGRLLVVHHPEPPSIEQAHGEVAALRELAAGGGEVSLLMIVDKPFPPPGTEVRAVYRDAVVKGDRVAAVAMLLPAGIIGVAASVVMSVSTGVFGGTRIPMKVFTAADAALRWLREHAELRASMPQMLDAVQRLRDRSAGAS